MIHTSERRDSYYEEYKRHKNTVDGRQKESLLTDRNAYMAYLEVQLERVTAACMTTDGVRDRVEQIQSHVGNVEEKVLNLTKLVKLAQGYTEQQEDLQRGVHEKQTETNRALDETKKHVTRLEEALREIQARAPSDSTSFRTSALEGKLLTMIQEQTREFHAKHSAVEAKVLGVLDEQERDMNHRLTRVESKLASLADEQRRDWQRATAVAEQKFTKLLQDQLHDFRDHATTLEQKVLALVDKLNLEVVSQRQQERGELESVRASLAREIRECEEGFKGLRRQTSSFEQKLDSVFQQFTNQSARTATSLKEIEDRIPSEGKNVEERIQGRVLQLQDRLDHLEAATQNDDYRVSLDEFKKGLLEEESHRKALISHVQSFTEGQQERLVEVENTCTNRFTSQIKRLEKDLERVEAALRREKQERCTYETMWKDSISWVENCLKEMSRIRVKETARSHHRSGSRARRSPPDEVVASSKLEESLRSLEGLVVTMESRKPPCQVSTGSKSRTSATERRKRLDEMFQDIMNTDV